MEPASQPGSYTHLDVYKRQVLSDILVSRRTPFESSISLSGKLCTAGANNFSILVTLASMALSMWVVCPPGAVLLLFIMTLFLLFMVQYYGDIIRPLVTQPLSNRQKKTENANLGQKNSRETQFTAIQ